MLTENLLLKKVGQRAKRFALTDPLTRLFNRGVGLVVVAVVLPAAPAPVVPVGPVVGLVWLSSALHAAKAAKDRTAPRVAYAFMGKERYHHKARGHQAPPEQDRPLGWAR